MVRKTFTSLILSLSFVVVAAFVTTNEVHADCESNYGGGETCIYNKSFEVKKRVKIEGDDDWEDKVTDVDEDDVIVFQIRIENVGEVEVDDMKYKDELPDELERIGGDGLTEEWDNFEPGDVKKFEIKAQIDDDDFDYVTLKCVVNKVEVYYDEAFEGSDTATVCYGDEEITELPETGPTTSGALAIAGLVLSGAGMLVKKQI